MSFLLVIHLFEGEYCHLVVFIQVELSDPYRRACIFPVLLNNFLATCVFTFCYLLLLRIPLDAVDAKGNFLLEQIPSPHLLNLADKFKHLHNRHLNVRMI